ncbi:response regulator [Metabacillus idriensis]|uniref:response regulator transcription factor n=1 Tax=Metabacillus idriensis TaxID=324768 RepID=UPI002812BD29|nr:response regulator [Metabacillus idriensis]MDR0138922.1 response regulator [Metabacillus idriensis]
MKLLITEDEEIERLALKKMIETDFKKISIVGLAENGRMAIELASEHKPDIILMDIKMPGINGLEAIKEIQKIVPNAKILIVSSYDTFDYAQQALRLGVKDYLLKPSKREVILSTIQKVINDIELDLVESEKKQKTEERIQKMIPIVEADLVTQLLFDHVHDVHLHECMNLLDVDQTQPSFVLLVHFSQDSLTGPIEQMYGELKKTIQLQSKGWVGPMSGLQVPIIVFSEGELHHYRRNAIALVQKILNNLKGLFSASAAIGIGKAYPALEQIRQSYYEALRASITAGSGARYSFYSDMISNEEMKDRDMHRIEELILEELRIGKWEGVRSHFQTMTGYFEKFQHPLAEAEQKVYDTMTLMIRYLDEMGFMIRKPVFSFSAKSYLQMKTEVNFILEDVISQYKQATENLQDDIPNRMKQHIKKNCHTDLSLEAMAKEFNLSPQYVSKIFKEELGISYIDYLTKCRIEKAKKMMEKGSHSLKEIAFEVGYNDPNYFSRVFKKVCKKSPSQYKDSLVNIAQKNK